MKVVTFSLKDRVPRGGVLIDDHHIHPLPFTGGDDVLAHITGPAEYPPPAATFTLDQVTLLAPLRHPPRIFGIGLNYLEHAAESKMKVQGVPTVFLKLSSSITGPDAAILLPPEATQPDYEAELAVVIGQGGFRIAPEKWEEHVFGYTIINDVSARGVQLATSQWTLGKSFPTFTPMGPWIVTKDEIPDPHDLDIKLTLSNEVLQDASTRDMIFRIPELIAYLSTITPLEPGDIITTGTPPGVGMGRTPQRWLLPEDECVIDIEGIGRLRNRTRAVSSSYRP